MKTIVKKNQPVCLYTVADIARLLGESPNRLWKRIHGLLSIPFEAPACRYGNRRYFTEEQKAKLVPQQNPEGKSSAQAG